MTALGMPKAGPIERYKLTQNSTERDGEMNEVSTFSLLNLLITSSTIAGSPTDVIKKPNIEEKKLLPDSIPNIGGYIIFPAPKNKEYAIRPIPKVSTFFIYFSFIYLTLGCQNTILALFMGDYFLMWCFNRVFVE
ncbi:hypothetical protein XIS1_650015 [Xenorhabdus innexi]|uniref:Uncharacterized protein n=1 Tax=Xenorhabdus innexi TaxID=290109 RepID=A0A1N6N033_9GAMM|nr:hypothetical protein XIS1_650015 [Xenorhabdus innexi]